MKSVDINVGYSVNWNTWVDIVEEAAVSQANANERSYIYRVIDPRPQMSNYSLRLMNPSELNDFHEVYKQNRWNSNYGKMQFADVIQISRICLSKVHNVSQKERVINALRLMADKAESKYENGWLGIIRKVFSAISNIFLERSIDLFHTANSSIQLKMPYDAEDSLPYFYLGSNASLARQLADFYDR